MKKLGTGDLEPIHITAKTSYASSSEIRAHLLCVECEQRFHKNGESYVLKNCYRGLGEFRLQEVLIRSCHPRVFPEATLCATAAISEVETDKLVYFASSVFWRSSVGRWRDGDQALITLSLGPYEEEFRLYLLGETTFPSTCVIQVNVNSREAPLAGMFTLPIGTRNDDCHVFTFRIPGLDFTLLVGKLIPEAAYKECTHASPEKYVGFMDDDCYYIDGIRDLAEGSRPVGKLKNRNTRSRPDDI